MTESDQPVTRKSLRSALAAAAFVAAALLASPARANPEATAPEAMALADVFAASGYDWEAVRAGEAEVPKLSTRALPRDLARLADLELKKSLFFRALLPVVLQVNAEIAAERRRLAELGQTLRRGEFLPPRDEAWLAALSERYGAATVESLMTRVDGVPPSLVLAQAAEESGWGSSRFVREGNALFGQYTWNDDHDGILPQDNEPGDTARRVRAFPSVKGAVAAYVHNLNSHRAYARFRALRASGASGYELTRALDRYSERGGEYGETLRMIIRANRLAGLDDARLATEVQVAGNP